MTPQDFQNRVELPAWAGLLRQRERLRTAEPGLRLLPVAEELSWRVGSKHHPNLRSRKARTLLWTFIL